MSLPIEWVERIFAKLTLAYGRDFLGRWEGVDLADVKTDWAHELEGFGAHPEAIAYALANLPPKAPTVIEFRSVARRAPAPDVPRIEAPRADPERVNAEMAKLAPLKAQAAERSAHDPKAWAKRHITNHQAGGHVRPITLKYAREALGIKEVA